VQRIHGLTDAQVLDWEARLEAQMVESLQIVMDKIAARILRSAPALVAAITTGPTGDDDPPPQTGDLAIPAPEPDPPAIPSAQLGAPPGQPYISADDLASIPPLWQEQVASEILPLVAEVFVDAAQVVHASLLSATSPGEFRVPLLGSQAAEQYLRAARNTYEQVGDHLWATARAQLSEGFEAGESIDQLAARLRQSAGLTARTGVLVARTSVIEASNFGSISMARASGLQMQKEWIATPDLRTRPTHLAADGQRVDLAEPFTVGGFSADFPAAPTLPPSERYSCRCTVGYVMPDKPKPVEAPSPGLDELPGTNGVAVEVAPPDVFPREAGPGFDLPARGEQPAGYIRPSLQAAKTPRQLRRVWQDEVEAITGFPFLVDAMPRGISMITAREYAEGVLQMFAQFPGAKLDRVHWFDDAASSAYAQVRRGGHAMEFNMKYASEAARPKFLAARRRDVAGYDNGGVTSWGVRNDVPGQGLVYHEFMHILDIENAREAIHGQLVPLLIREAQREGVTDIADLIQRRISSYAASARGSYQELVAEAGTDVMVNGAAASQLSREIFGLLRAEYRRRGFEVRTAPLDELAEEAERAGDIFPKITGPVRSFDERLAAARAGYQVEDLAPVRVEVDASSGADTSKWKAIDAHGLEGAQAGLLGAVTRRVRVSGPFNEYLRFPEGKPLRPGMAAYRESLTPEARAKFDAQQATERAKMVASAERDIKALDKAMAQSRMLSDVVAWRSGRITGLPDGDAVGFEYVDPGYVGVTGQREVAASFAAPGRVTSRILVPEGTPAINIYGGGEGELLLARGLRFRVVADRRTAAGVRELDLEVVPTAAPPVAVAAPKPIARMTVAELRAEINKDSQLARMKPARRQELLTILRRADADPDGQAVAGIEDLQILESTGLLRREVGGFTEANEFGRSQVIPTRYLLTDKGRAELSIPVVPAGARKADLVRLVEEAPPAPATTVVRETVVRTPEAARALSIMERPGPVPIRPLVTKQDEFVAPWAISPQDPDYAWLRQLYERDPKLYNQLARERQIEQFWELEARKKYRGKTIEEAQAEATRVLREAVDDAPIIIRRSTEARLRQAIEDGRLKTQFETGTSSGLLDVEARRRLEDFTFDLPPGLPLSERPVYGLVSPGGVRPALESQAVHGYGDIQLVLKPSVRERTTVTVGDSLAPIGEKPVITRPAPIDAPDWQAAGPHGRPDLGTTQFERRDYIEAQVRGGVRMEDIEEIVFARIPESATISALDSAGIHWRVLTPKGDITPPRGVAVAEAPPLSRAPLAYQARQAELREAAARPVISDEQVYGGESAYVRRLEHEGGPPTITKDTMRIHQTKAQGARDADAEELGSLAADAVGLRAPTVIRLDRTKVETELIEGEPGDFGQTGPVDTDDGRLMGLLDYLTGNGDRSKRNWFTLPDGRLASIDMGDAFRTPKLAGTRDEFGSSLMLDEAGKPRKIIDFNPADLAVIRMRLEALRSEFERLGRATWHRQVMARLADVEKRADPAAAIRLAETRPDLARITSPVARDLQAYESRLSAARTGRVATKAPTVRFSVDADGADRVTGLDRLTLAERERVAVALDDYRGFEFSAINDMLRGVDADALRAKYGVGAVSAARGNRTFLDLAFEGSPLREDVIVWRAPGSGRGIFGDPATWGDDLAGFEWSDPAYSSTSASKAISDRFMKDGGVRLRILAPKDTRAIHLAESGIEDELELLLDRGTQFRVVKDNGWKTVVHPETKSKIRVRDLDVEVVPKAPVPVDVRAAQRTAVRAQAATIATQRANAALIARIDELVQAKASKAVIRQELDPALREAEQLYAGADEKLADALRTAVDSGEAAKIRAALTRQSRASKITPIGKAGAKAKFDPDTMEGVGGTAIPDGADVIVVRRGARIEGIETPEKATVRLARAPSSAKTVAKGDFGGLTRTGEAMGGNPGGIFEAGDGSRWYVKQAAGLEQARSEALTLDLYRAAGLDAPEMVIGEGVQGLGQRQIATRFLDDAEVDLRLRMAEDPAYIREVQDGFGVDAWLANWDVVGANPVAGWDNIVSVAGRPVRIEAGGALRFRGLGGEKAFGPDVLELDTLRDPQTARRAAQVFGDMTPEQIIASAERVRKVTPAKIKALVKKHNLDPELADTLIARREDILRRAEALAGPKPMTPREFAAAIKAAAKRQEALDVVPYSTTGRAYGPLYEPDAIDRYRVDAEINAMLRGLDDDRHLVGDIHAIDEVFDGSRLQSDVELWRGVGSGRSVFGDPATWGDDLAGFEWVDPAYSSASAVKRVADRFISADGAPRLRILAPKGSKAIQLSGAEADDARIGISYIDEAEVLLGRGARYRVVRDRGWTEIAHPTTRRRIRVRDLDVEVVVPDETPPLPWETGATT